MLTISYIKRNRSSGGKLSHLLFLSRSIEKSNHLNSESVFFVGVSIAACPVACEYKVPTHRDATKHMILGSKSRFVVGKLAKAICAVPSTLLHGRGLDLPKDGVLRHPPDLC